MPFMDFDEECLLNVPEMDAEHREWVALFNFFSLRIYKNARDIDSARRFQSFTLRHFKDEEAFMAKIGFGLEAMRAHIAEHEKIGAFIELVIAQYEDNPFLVHLYSIRKAQRLFKNHLINFDRKYAEYYLSRANQKKSASGIKRSAG
jgi:hemerythrin-like metal-binding protein